MDSALKTEKHAFWKEHIEKWQASGLSQPCYCEAHGIRLSTFQYYRHFVLHTDVASKPIHFVAVKPNNISASVSALQLMLPNGIRVGISEEVSETLLKMVLKVLGEMRC